jgi:phosphomannomutase/hydroxymethylpyrimidine pyrophosphatase-like HAD family hydrolase
MKTALAFDIDNTLTPPRQPINKTMTEVLKRLRVPFFVAAGSHLSLLQDQFFRPLYDFGFRKQFDAFLSNGAMRYHCDYSKGMSIKLISEFNIRDHLGEGNYNYLLKKLTETLEMKKFQLPPSLKVLDGRIVDRVSMINLCPIGRMRQEDSDARCNRENFVEFDRANGYREKLLGHLNHELSSLIRKKQLKITLGGQTSFDIGIVGQDKTNPVRTLLENGFKRVVFIGDALFKDGNDAAIIEFIKIWPLNSECPVEAIQVSSWRETINILRNRKFLNEPFSGRKPMSSKKLTIKPYVKKWQEIKLTEKIVTSYSLEKWAENFSLMTAGYRDQLNPDDANDPKVAFNLLTVAILGEAKSRVFKRKLASGEQAHVHVGGETRPHTQDFIAILSRVYAAHNFIVHLRANVKTTPIWYSSFGIFYKGYQSGDNLTASHSPFFKGGWKPVDSCGKQLLTEEKEIIAEVRNIVKDRAKISLAPWGSEAKILYDFDIDEAYVRYQQSVIIDQSKDDIRRAIEKGFHCFACTVGGSMKATTERLFPMLGIPTGPDRVIQYIFGEEDSQYHHLGEKNGKHFGPDPSKKEVYKNIGAQEILLNGKADIVFLWDPDGDRFNIVTTTSCEQAEKAKDLGLEVDLCSSSNKSIVYFSPNQIFFMLTAYRISILKEAGLLNAYDWFITPSISTSRSLGELAAKENIPVAQVRVGFKYVGTFSEWLENRTGPNEPFINAIGDKIYIGKKPRALIMCEESGGAVFGGTEFLMNERGSSGMIALREKDGFQFGLMTLSLATHLYNSNRSFADYYCRLIEEHNIQNRFFNRKDVRLYDESLTGPEREKTKADGEEKRDRVMDFFRGLAKQASAGKSLDEIHDEISLKLADGDKSLPKPKRVCVVGEGKLLEGTLMEFDDFWFLIRASGTDALLRYYIEGKDKDEIKAYQRAFINLRI